MVRRTRAPVALLAAFVVAVAGCGDPVQDESELTVWVQAAPGEEAAALLQGAQRALDDAGEEAAGVTVRVEVAEPAEESSRWRAARIGAAARAASEDAAATAYIAPPGEAGAHTSIPITNSAGLLQVSAGPTAPTLLSERGSNDPPAEVQASGERTVIALAPADAPRRPAEDYGYEAMALVLDSIERAADPLDRRDVLAAALATSERRSEIGTYTVDPRGLAVQAE